MLSKNSSRLFIVTSRLPLRIENTTEKIHLYSSKDGVVEGIRAFATKIKNDPASGFRELHWAGAPGCSTGTWARMADRIPLLPYGICPLFIQPEEPDVREFAGAMMRYIRPNDTIWIPDTRLLPLADQIRREMPEINIGLFVAVEFPTYEAMWKMPREEQENLLRGMLGADVVVFRAEEARNNFLQCMQLLLGIDSDEKIIRNVDRLIPTAVIPVGDGVEGIGYWLQEGLALLRTAKERQARFQVRFFDIQTRNDLLDRYRNAQRRLFLLDYDGTLTPFFNLPSLAKPDNLLLDILANIARNPRNSVYIVSGRDSDTLDSWLGHLPVNIIAEHGARVRHHDGQWQERAMPVMQWRNAVEKVMRRYSEKCTNSFVEQKDHSMVWHYRNALPEQVREVKMELYAELCGIGEVYGLQVMLGNKIIEVRNSGVDKGSAIGHVLAGGQQDFILAIGDDRTDEDMFRMLTEIDHACTIKVGVEASFAQFNMHTPQMVISLLGNLVNMEGG